MKGLATTHKGFEDISALEITEFIGKKSISKETTNIFDIDSFKDLCLLTYKGQSFIKIIYLIDSFTFEGNPFDKILKSVEKTDLKDFSKNKTFRTDCQRHGKHDFSSQEISKIVGLALQNKLNMEVDMKNPDIIFFIYIYKNNCYFGVDFSGIDLSKRDYKIFFSPMTLKGTIAFSMLKFADYSGKDILLDPMCNSGIIPIEASLYSCNFSVNYYRKDRLAFSNLKNIDSESFFEKEDKKADLKTKTNIIGYDNNFSHIMQSKKNSKIAGVNKKINFSKIDINWLDTKFKENEINRVVTFLPSPSKRLSEGIVKKLITEFFYQLKYILNKKGNVVVAVRLSKLLKEAAKTHKFKLKEEKEIWHGKESLQILKFVK